MRSRFYRTVLPTAFGRVLPAVLVVLLVLAACAPPPENGAPSSGSDPVAEAPSFELSGLQLELITRAAPTAGLSTQAQALATQAQLDVLGPSGNKDGILAKAGSQLALLYREHQALLRGELAPQQASPIASGDSVIVDAVATGNARALLADLEALGLEHGAIYDRMVSGRLPIAAIERAAALPSLLTIRPALAVTDVGLVTSEGDAAMRSDEARSTFGVDGSGVMVGILSDSFDRAGPCGSFPGPTFTSYADDIASGDLPPNVKILDDSVDCGAGPTDEGRAMAQLVYDVAPGSDLAFHTAFNGQADFAQGIIELKLNGSHVITDDVIYFAEPMFQDGIIAQAVDFVGLAGIPYFSSAGNRSRRSWEGYFEDSGVPGAFGGTLHDFDPGPGVDLCQTFVLGPNQTFIPAFQWDDPFASASRWGRGAGSDFDIFLTFDDCTPIGPNFASLAPNIGGDPFEIVGVINTGAAPLTLGLSISHYAGPSNHLLKYVNFGSSTVPVEYGLDAPSSYGHNDATYGRGVGAAFYQQTPVFGVDPPVLEPFSSHGGVPKFFNIFGKRLYAPEVRPQPDFVAPDGTNTTFFFFDTVRDPDSFPNFFGTSAAAPHAAGVAALAKDGDPWLTSWQIYRAMQRTAIDMDAPGFDFATGHGLIQADRILEQLLGSPSSPPPPPFPFPILPWW